MRFTHAQYEEAICCLEMAKDQIEPDGRCCAICGDSGHQAFECGHNPLVAMVICERLARDAEQLHEAMHLLAGFDFHMGQQLGPRRIHAPEVRIADAR